MLSSLALPAFDSVKTAANSGLSRLTCILGFPCSMLCLDIEATLLYELSSSLLDSTSPGWLLQSQLLPGEWVHVQVF